MGCEDFLELGEVVGEEAGGGGEGGPTVLSAFVCAGGMYIEMRGTGRSEKDSRKQAQDGDLPCRQGDVGVLELRVEVAKVF